METLRTDITEWVIGPYHAILPGPMRLHLELDGELVVGTQVETGFVHRGIEKAMELQAWRALLPYADRVDPDTAFFGELLVCMAQESLCGIAIPPRAQGIRGILSELARVSAVLLNLGKLGRLIGLDTISHYVSRDRERVLDLLELLTGSRFSYHFVRVGGVRQDITDGFLERVVEFCDLMRFRAREYNNLFIFNRTVRERIEGIGFLSLEAVKKWSMSGPTARASGEARDVRREQPYLNYGKMDFIQKLPTQNGDVFSRLLWWKHELDQSCGFLRQMVEGIKAGPFRESGTRDDMTPPKGESYVRIESSRGEYGCHLVSEGERTPSRVQLRTPSVFTLAALPEILQGVRVEDIGPTLASLDLSLAEVDR